MDTAFWDMVAGNTKAQDTLQRLIADDPCNRSYRELAEWALALTLGG